MSEKAIDTKAVPIGPKMKLKIGLFRRYWENHIQHEQNKELEAIYAALRRNRKTLSAAIHNTTDFSLALAYLDEREMLLNRGKGLFHQIQDQTRRMYEQITKENQQEDIMIESKLDGTLDEVSAIRILLKILQEKDGSASFLDRLRDLFDWLELKRPALIFLGEQIINRHPWQVITMESSQCRHWDDMPQRVRRKHGKFRQMLELAGCKAYYDISPSFGTKITIMVSPVIREGKIILINELFESLETPLRGA